MSFRKVFSLLLTALVAIGLAVGVGVGSAAAEEIYPSEGNVLGTIVVDGIELPRVASNIDPDGYLPEDLMEARGPAPWCMTAYMDSNLLGRWVDAKNNCGNTQRAKILISNAFDSPCFQFVPGQSIRHKYPLWGVFDGLASC